MPSVVQFDESSFRVCVPRDVEYCVVRSAYVFARMYVLFDRHAIVIFGKAQGSFSSLRIHFREQPNSPPQRAIVRGYSEVAFGH